MFRATRDAVRLFVETFEPAGPFLELVVACRRTPGLEGYRT